MHGSEFEIDTSLSSAQKQLVKDRVVARIMRMLNSAYSFVSSGFSQVDGLEDDPISSTTNESLDNLFERKYGERILVSKLPQLTILGRMHRNIQSGTVL